VLPTWVCRLVLSPPCYSNPFLPDGPHARESLAQRRRGLLSAQQVCSCGCSSPPAHALLHIASATRLYPPRHAHPVGSEKTLHS
jgi:hypothetical protein